VKINKSLQLQTGFQQEMGYEDLNWFKSIP